MLSLYFGNDDISFLTEILKKIENKKYSKTILVVPDQYSFYTEKFTYEKVKKNNPKIDINVFSFKKLCFRIFKKYGYIAGNFATKTEKILALNKTFLTLSNELKKNNIQHNKRILELILKSIEELTKNDISAVFFKEKLKKIKDVELKTKCKIFLNIFELYEKNLKRNFKDPTKNIKKALEFSKNHNIFKDKNIYFLFFLKFNALELELIELMLKQGDLFFLMPYEKKENIFKTTQKTLNVLTQIAQKNNIKITKQKYINKNSEKTIEINKIEENIFKQNKKIKNKISPTNVKIFITKNKQKEVETAIEKAIYLNKKGLKWQDIIIISRYIKDYETQIKLAFENVGIPYFFDESIFIKDMLLIKIAKNILELITNFNIKTYLTILKTNLTKFKTEEILDFENIVNSFNTTKRSIKIPFEEKNNENKKQINNANKVKKTLFKLFNLFKNSKNSSKEISKKLIESFNVLGIKQKIENEIKNEIEKEEYKLQWEALINILIKIYSFTEKETILKNQFKSIFNSTCEAEKIKKVPEISNCILICEINTTVPINKKAVFILGAKEELPLKYKNSEEFFKNEEIIKLKKVGLKFLLTEEEKNSLEAILTYKAASCPFKYLFVFCSQGLDEQKSDMSELVEELIKIFGEKIVEKVDEKNHINGCLTEKIAFKKLLIHYKEKTKEIEALKQYFKKKESFFKAIETKNAHNIALKDYFNKNISPSQIEQFSLCPFSYFCRYILKMNKIKEEDLDEKIIGSLTHNVLEKIVSLNNFLNLNESEILEEITKLLKNILNSNFIKKQTISPYFLQKYFNLIPYLKDICCHIQNELKAIGFKPKYFEYLISSQSKIKPLKIEINKDSSVFITGIIDRIDTKNIGEKKFLRIIDYKYNKKTFNYSDFLNGLNLQIILYLLAIQKNIINQKNTNILGIFYMPTIGVLKQYNSFKKKPKEEKNLQNKKLTANALILNLDETKEILEQIKSDSYKEYTPIRVTKDKTFNKIDAAKTLISKEELKLLFCFIENKIKFMVSSIEKLDFKKQPKNLPQKNILYCDYCDFKEICDENEITKPKKQKNLNKQEFLEIVNENLKEI